MGLLRSRVRGYSVTVTREHVEAFERMLKSKAPKTREKRMMYLRRALEDLGWKLSTERHKNTLLSFRRRARMWRGMWL